MRWSRFSQGGDLEERRRLLLLLPLQTTTTTTTTATTTTTTTTTSSHPPPTNYSCQTFWKLEFAKSTRDLDSPVRTLRKYRKDRVKGMRALQRRDDPVPPTPPTTPAPRALPKSEARVCKVDKWVLTPQQMVESTVNAE